MPKLNYEVVVAPQSLSEQENGRLATSFAKVSSAACSVGQKVKETDRVWKSFFSLVEQQPSTFDRLVYVEDENGQIVSYTAFRSKRLMDRPLLYWSLSMTLPEYSQTTVTGRSWFTALDPEFLLRFRGGFVAARTVNPSIYLATRHFLLRRLVRGEGSEDIDVRFYPQILSENHIEKVPDEILKVASALMLSSGMEKSFNPSTFVVLGSLKKFGSLYPHYNFQCRDKTVNAYFTNNLSYERQDSLLILCELKD